MNEALSMKATESAPVACRPNGIVRRYSLVGACAFTSLGITMLILALFTPMTIIVNTNEIILSESIIFKIAEVVFSIGMIHGAIMLWNVILNKKRTFHGVGILPGDAALANAFFYLGFSMTAFHLGYTSPAIALAQFITVLMGLFFGAGGLIWCFPAGSCERTYHVFYRTA